MKLQNQKIKKNWSFLASLAILTLFISIPVIYAQSSDTPEISILMINNSINYDFDISGDGQKIVTNGYDWIHLADIPESFGGNSVKNWNVSTTNSFSGVSICDDGSKIVVQDNSNFRLMCYPATGSDPIWYYELEPGAAMAPIISGDGSVITISQALDGGSEYELLGFDGTTGNVLWEKTYPESINKIDIDQSGTIVAVGFFNGSVACFNAKTGIRMWQHPGAPINPINALVLSESGNTVVSYSGAEKNFTVWDVAQGDVLWSSTIPIVFNSIDLSENGENIILGSYNDEHTENKIPLYERSQKTLVWEVECAYEVYSARISNDGTYVIAGDRDGIVNLIHTDDGTKFFTHETYTDNIVNVEVSNDGEIFAVLTAENSVFVYSLNTSGNSNINSISDFFSSLGLYHYGFIAIIGILAFLIGGMIFKNRK